LPDAQPIQLIPRKSQCRLSVRYVFHATLYACA
jgi:hypothetical protein